MNQAVTSPPIRIGNPLPLPASVRLLADHLDTALAMGEDLLAVRQALDRPGPGDIRPIPMHALIVEQRQIGDFVSAVRTLELAMTARILQARKLAVDLRRTYPRFRQVADLFRGGTAIIEDAVSAADGNALDRFDTGETAMSFLRSRAIIAADAAGLTGLAALYVCEDTLLLGTIRLGTAMDLLARFLDALDAAFDLYPEDRSSGLSVPAVSPAVSNESSTGPLQHAPDKPSGTPGST